MRVGRALHQEPRTGGTLLSPPALGPPARLRVLLGPTQLDHTVTFGPGGSCLPRGSGGASLSCKCQTHQGKKCHLSSSTWTSTPGPRALTSEALHGQRGLSLANAANNTNATHSGWPGAWPRQGLHQAHDGSWVRLCPPSVDTKPGATRASQSWTVQLSRSPGQEPYPQNPSCHSVTM